MDLATCTFLLEPGLPHFSSSVVNKTFGEKRKPVCTLLMSQSKGVLNALSMEQLNVVCMDVLNVKVLSDSLL